MTSALITAQHLASAAEARLLIAISFHFVKGRLIYLEKVLQSLAAFPVLRRDIVVFTNTTDLAEQESIRRAFRKAGLADGPAARLAVEADLLHPFNLTWAHKKLISGIFLAPDSPYSHFVYLEDDLQLTFENFAYFVTARDILRPFGNLAPGFLRTEWSARRECLVNHDNIAPILLANRPFIRWGDFAWVGADVPYCAGFILDQELAREYVHARSFDLKRSRAASAEMIHYGVRERAALGLTFENPPAPFACRVVVPVSIASHGTPPCACLAHLPNNYADNPIYPHAKIAMTDLMAGEFDPKKEVTLASFQSASQRMWRFGDRVRRNFRTMCREARLNILDVLRLCKKMICGPGASRRE